ncbi:MAG TPA: TIGR03557 family F420-dependent LLM class oxidoreductase [Candidatus Saccharimonadales bacterium]|nr:TIGR03557 family F420-dependent LLM class oxidoreductase [Candidatus Saccharimonadales bacterium]
MAKIYLFCSAEQFHPEVIVKQAILAEEVGFDGVMISEHFHPWVHDEGTSGFTFSTLGAIAAKTKRINLMTAVTTPLFRYHPGVVAQAAATIDRLSDGRFELGIGSGENINEKPLGYNFPGYAERSKRLVEAIEIIRRLLNSEGLDFNGEFYQTNSAKLYSPPSHTVPIFLAAGGAQTASTAVKYCDGMIVSVKDVNETKEILKTISPTKASSFKIIASRWSIYAQTDEQAWQALLPQRGLRAPSRGTAGPKELQREADSMPKSDILSKYHRLKTPEDYISAYSPLITDIKADVVGIQTTSLDQPRTIKMLGREVLPKLTKL